MTFGTGVSVPSVILPPASRSWASATLSSGSRDRGVVAASNILQGVRGSSHSQGCRGVSGTDRFLQGRWQANQKHCYKKTNVWADTMRKMLFEFPYGGDTGLEALHLHGESEQLKIGLQFAPSKLPKPNFFQKINRLILFLADIDCV